MHVSQAFKYLFFVFLFFCYFLPLRSFSQEKFDFGELHGDFQTDFQTYKTDSSINAVAVPEKSGSNSYLNLMYYRGSITAGVRFEGYYPAMQGFDRRYKGGGIPYRFVTFKKFGLEVTAGNFYEQFGNGLTLRTYWEWGLGYDNSLDGIRVRYLGIKGFKIKGLVAEQRFYFAKSPGIIRGIDGEIFLNDLIPGFDSVATKISLGGSFVSKYEAASDPVLTLPENVSVYGGRANLTCKTISIATEYAYKINDPSEINGNIYKNGEALWMSASYAPENFAVVAQFKRIDNMNFRSSRAATGNDLMINYLPASTPQYTYRLATLYPYATQPNGEIGIQLDLMYRIKEGTLLGGKYGTKISLNYSVVNNIRKLPIDSIELAKEPNAAYLGYNASISDDLGLNGGGLRLGGQNLYKNLNIEISKKLTDRWKITASYLHIQMDNRVLKLSSYHGIIDADILIAEVLYKIKSRKTIKIEAQHLSSRQDYGNWASVQAEYVIGPHWFFSVLDDYNYGYLGDTQPDDTKDIFNAPNHYLSGTIGYNHKTTKISLNYGKRRAGVLCVGGVCRLVPATNGLTVSISSSF